MANPPILDRSIFPKWVKGGKCAEEKLSSLLAWVLRTENPMVEYDLLFTVKEDLLKLSGKASQQLSINTSRESESKRVL